MFPQKTDRQISLFKVFDFTVNGKRDSKIDEILNKAPLFLHYLASTHHSTRAYDLVKIYFHPYVASGLEKSLTTPARPELVKAFQDFLVSKIDFVPQLQQTVYVSSESLEDIFSLTESTETTIDAIVTHLAHVHREVIEQMAAIREKLELRKVIDEATEAMTVVRSLVLPFLASAGEIQVLEVAWDGNPQGKFIENTLAPVINILKEEYAISICKPSSFADRKIFAQQLIDLHQLEHMIVNLGHFKQITTITHKVGKRQSVSNFQDYISATTAQYRDSYWATVFKLLAEYQKSIGTFAEGGLIR